MRVAFVIPALEIDAAWDPARRAPFIGVWAMASLLKERGHEVHYLDESFANDGWFNRRMFKRTVHGRTVKEEPVRTSWRDFQAAKMADFRQLGASAFTAKYSAFKDDGSVERMMCRIGAPEVETLNYIADHRIEVVCIPLVATANYEPATRLVRKIKRRYPHVRVILGGQHITANPAKFLRENRLVDYVAEGDAITTIEDMVRGRHLTKVVPGGFQQMNAYPLLDYSIIKDAGYPEKPTHNLPTGLRTVEWMASRGCYRDCAFCFAGRKEQQVTQSEWVRIEEQLAHFADHGIEEIIFQDDAWLYKAKARFPTLLYLMKERGLSFSNNGGVEFESFTPEIAEMLVQYNEEGRGRCTSLYVPFNPRGWNAAMTAVGAMTQHNKYLRNLESLRLVREAGIYVFTSLIVGTPDQSLTSYEEDLATLRLLISGGYLDAALPLSATMLPGTVWYDRNGHNIVQAQDWAGFSLFTTHHRTDFMTPPQIEECMVRTVKELEDLQDAGPWQTAFPEIN